MKKQLVFALKLTFCLAFTLAVMVPFAQSKKVKANGIMIAYETFGRDADPKIICINGTGAQMTEWPIAFCEKLSAQGFQVIRFDNRDVGLSEKMIALGAPDWAAIAPFVKTCKPAPTPYSLMDMAKDVIGLMDGLKIEKAHIVGASMGGAIAQLVAIHYPERTLSLSSIAASSGNPNLPAADPKAMQAMATPPPASKDPDTLTTYLVNIFKALGTTDDEATLKKRALAQVSRSWDPEGSARQVAAILIADNCDRRTDLAKIKVPSLIIHGDADPLVNVQAAKEINAAIPNSALQIIKGMGHDFSSGFIETIASLVAKNAGKIQRN